MLYSVLLGKMGKQLNHFILILIQGVFGWFTETWIGLKTDVVTGSLVDLAVETPTGTGKKLFSYYCSCP